jgi:phosphomethylpyrimidine synthase
MTDTARPLDERLALSRQPFPASKKIHAGDLRVPMREVALTNGETITLYDTSGPYTDPAATIDVRRGLAPMRAAWIADRADTEPYAGRMAQALDDGTKDEAAERLRALRADAAARVVHLRDIGAVRAPAPMSRRCTTRAAAS